MFCLLVVLVKFQYLPSDRLVTYLRNDPRRNALHVRLLDIRRGVLHVLQLKCLTCYVGHLLCVTVCC